MLHKYAKDITYCAFCPKLCRFSCPVAQLTASETYTPTGKMNLLYLAQNNALQPNIDFSEIMFYGCSGCFVCKEYCKWKIDIPQIIQYARGILIKNNIVPQEISIFLEKINNFKNPFGSNTDEKLKEILSSCYFEKSDEVLYFPGCKAIEYFPENITNTINFFKKFNIKFSVLNEVMCCGDINFKLGDINGYNSLKSKLKKKLTHFKKIVCSCPECTYTLRKRYNIKNTFHIVEFINYFCHGYNFSYENEAKTIMYFDPCYLARYLNVINEPRNILNLCNARVIDFLWSKERTKCCGGILNFIKHDFAQKLVAEKIKEAKDKKQTTIVTSCPQCQYLLSSNQNEIEIKDIVDFVVERIK